MMVLADCRTDVVYALRHITIKPAVAEELRDTLDSQMQTGVTLRAGPVPGSFRSVLRTRTYGPTLQAPNAKRNSGWYFFD